MVEYPHVDRMLEPSMVPRPAMPWTSGIGGALGYLVLVIGFGVVLHPELKAFYRHGHGSSSACCRVVWIVWGGMAAGRGNEWLDSKGAGTLGMAWWIHRVHSAVRSRYEKHRVSHRHDLCVSLLGPFAFGHWHFWSPHVGEVAMGYSTRSLRAAGTGTWDLSRDCVSVVT